MKNIYVILAALLILFMLFLPLIALGGKQTQDLPPIEPTHDTQTQENNESTITVLNSETGENTKMNISDYIFGVVSAEMPAEYSEEALKAQAVAAYTYALYNKKENADKPYDITDSPNTDQHYISYEKACEKWGENAPKYSEKIKNAVKSVEGEYISFSGEPILALYHAISGGKTEDIADVFGVSLPYLVSSDSIGDLLENDYQTSVSLTPQQFSALLEDKVTLSGEAKNWVSDVKHRDNGYVKSVTICGKEFKGTEIRSIFSLRSANFDINFDGSFNFTVRGYGHGVGLSQSGAEYMAKQGGTYKEILMWYYKNCEIVRES